MSSEVNPRFDYPDFFQKGDPNCVHSDPDFFFPEAGTTFAVAHTRMAKEICSTCPYLAECLEWALKADEIGIWGGTTEAERRRMKRGVVLKPRRKWSGKSSSTSQ